MSQASPKFEVRKFHNNRGHEGPGYACELWMDGRLAAHVYDEGNGGSPTFHWSDAKTREFLQAYVKTLPPYHWEADKYSEAHDSPMDLELFMLQLVTAFETQKTFKRKCKTQTLIRLKSDKPDEYHIYKKPYTPELAAQIRTHYGEQLVEIINETLAKE